MKGGSLWSTGPRAFPDPRPKNIPKAVYENGSSMRWEGRKKWPFSSRPHCGSFSFCSTRMTVVSLVVFSPTTTVDAPASWAFAGGAPRQGGNHDQGRKGSTWGFPSGGGGCWAGRGRRPRGRDISPLAVRMSPRISRCTPNRTLTPGQAVGKQARRPRHPGGKSTWRVHENRPRRPRPRPHPRARRGDPGAGRVRLDRPEGHPAEHREGPARRARGHHLQEPGAHLPTRPPSSGPPTRSTRPSCKGRSTSTRSSRP